ncbi:hypothetical protein [Guptibacillus spartinae]|uniref:hypothetical protein n=1 Tax=Guptibacillus spartinae TaxID=3025679 RepID=UPI00236258F2|nr:hypothetical protein [Pseudalkalibacillus spartinae]
MPTKLSEGNIIKFNHENYNSSKEYVVTEVWEREAGTNEFNRMTSYENLFTAKELTDGEYDEQADEISFSTCKAYENSIEEVHINIVGLMRKTYVRSNF